jgi:hypothetical protein
MADLQTTHDPGTNRSVAPLLTGIVKDIQDLLKQNLALFKVEVRDDFRKTREAVAALGVGAALAAVGGLHLTLMLVFLLALIPGIPLWVCFGIVGAVFVGFGLALVVRGKKKFESFNPLPDESAEALKENVQCLTKNI